MKVLAIRGKNLASLEGEFEIDFTLEPLRSAGIFAITGNTGSGKSTLLDCLCLALYDDTPRASRATENSIQIVDVGDKTINQKDSRNVLRRGTSDGYAEVDFISLGGEIFRSRWSVRRSRDRVDGSLRTSEMSLVNLSTNIEVQGRKGELLSKIVELSGLTFEQFTRAVLLAQGDFATFLKATQKEKAELLEKLTGTDIYSRISSSIYERCKGAEYELNILTERMKDVDILPDNDLEAFVCEREGLVKEVDILKKDIALLDNKLKWIEELGKLSVMVKEGEGVFEESVKAVEMAKGRYEYIEKVDSVQEVRDDFIGLQVGEKQLADAKIALVKQEKERESNSILLNEAVLKLNGAGEELKTYIEKVLVSEPYMKEAKELDILLRGIKESLTVSNKEFNGALMERDAAAKMMESVKSEIEIAKKRVVEIEAWFEKRVEYKDIVPRVDLINNLLDDAAISKEQEIKNSKLLADSEIIFEGEIKKIDLLKVEQERLSKLLPAEIALLRGELIEGEPCPVCGSLHHPAGAVAGDSLREQELVKAKEDVRIRIEKISGNIDRLKEENVRLKSIAERYGVQYEENMIKLDDFLKSLPLWRTYFEKGSLQRGLKELGVNWEKNLLELGGAKENLVKFNSDIEHIHAVFTKASDNLSERKERLNEMVLEQGVLQKKRDGLLGGRDVEEVEKENVLRERELRLVVEKLTEERNLIMGRGEKFAGVIKNISEEINKLTIHCNSLRQRVLMWMSEKGKGMTSEQLMQLLSNDNQWLTKERTVLNSLKEVKASALATLAERQARLAAHYQSSIKPLDGEECDELQLLFSEKSAVVEKVVERITHIDMLFVNNEKGKEKIKSFEKELAEKSALCENWKKLNSLLGSADGAKFKVLAQGYTLDILLSYANIHLQELSKRYELQRIPDTLALQVADMDMLGEIRTVHSLSGGETFLISLALALGLSSLSSNRMKVESLFIDEGFGSLDIDTLRVALDALEHLQTQGRKIGVISHVAEMTERISTQIKLVKGANGKSRIEIISAS